MGTETYSESYVAFLDVLGFSQLVEKSETDFHKFATIRTIIEILRATFSEVPEGVDFKFTQFSDCIVISAVRTDAGLFAVATGCISVSNSLLSQGVLLRGGLAVGSIYHGHDALFGPGLLRAYRSDSTGTPPRIALCEQTVKDLETYGITDLMRRDISDLTPILHTFWPFSNYNPERAADNFLPEEASGLTEFISANSNDMTLSPSVRAKWRWLRLYWNDSVRFISKFSEVI